MDMAQGERARAKTAYHFPHYRNAYDTYNPFLKKWLHDPVVNMTAVEVDKLSAPFRNMAFASPRDENYPDRYYSLPDGAEELRQADSFMDKLFVHATVTKGDYDYYDDDARILAADRRMSNKESSAIAFIGNSIAFHPGVWTNTNKSSSSYVEGLSTHPDIVCYECRPPDLYSAGACGCNTGSDLAERTQS